MAEYSTNNQRSRKREKPILSCSHCRSRKLRCDRQTPCGACVRRGMGAECTFSISEHERSRAVDYRPLARRQQARQRVARLEDLVTEMRNQMQDKANSAPSSQPVNSPAGATVDDMGKLSLTDDQAVYTGSSHWVTILEDIQRLKDELSDDQSMDEPSSGDLSKPDTSLMTGSPATRISLLNSGPALSKEQILLAVPPRDITNKHISNFFAYFDMAPFILHKSKFLAELAIFWDNPASASIMWLGVLFGVFSISSFLARHNQHEASSEMTPFNIEDSMVQTYRAMAIHCLVAGDYLKPRQNTMEALILHFAVDQIVNVDGTVSSWVLMGVIVRLALRMGLHRDPSHWPSIRPLHAEMRRRLWISLYQMDFFTSVQVGLARIIKDAQCNALPPMHLANHDLDHDFEFAQMDDSGDSTTKPTPPLFIVQRNGIVKVAAAIYDATEEHPRLSQAALSSFEAQIESAIARVPSSFTYTTFEASMSDGPIITLHRVVLDILIQKTVYLLHRQSFVKRIAQPSTGGTKIETFASQDKCINAALSILKHQERLSRETVPGGQLYDIRWKVAASLNHEVLQAAMMLCFALSASSTALQEAMRQDISSSLAQVKMQWEDKAELSVETRKALNTISVILERTQKGLVSQTQERDRSLPASGGAGLDFSSSLDGSFGPVLDFSSQEYFDFSMFGYGDPNEPVIIDPFLIDPDIELDGTALKGYNP